MPFKIIEGGVFEFTDLSGSKKQVLLYRGEKLFTYNFNDITPNSEKFGQLVLWDTDSEYTSAAQQRAEYKGTLNNKQIEQLKELGPQKAKQFLKDTINYEYIDKIQPAEIDKS